MPRATVIVKTCGRGESVDVLRPELESLRAHVRAQLIQQEPSEVGMLPFSKHFPDVAVRKSLESCNFELQQMILVRI